MANKDLDVQVTAPAGSAVSRWALVAEVIDSDGTRYYQTREHVESDGPPTGPRVVQEMLRVVADAFNPCTDGFSPLGT